MTYLVLARKWRPRSFDTLIGQDHVVRALTHALSTQRLHHAWLFTGTRGVGKTTLSRILAKALNCEVGISATPCGQCQACVEIDAGRFVDYLELDAASNRGVDEMTQLLEQAVYAPSSGRYKVYMIDEVHMLTGHAFNAMLKTLEEPPAHVKFILATTDPQKIPVTVLSRCLQFNLKQMTVPAIVEHLEHILQHEQLPYEIAGLRLLAQSAAGSMRDALSLTDQAIAYSAGSVSTEAVQAMLGTIDQQHLCQLIDALIHQDAAQLKAVADDLALRGLSYASALADLASLLSQIAIEQRLPGATPVEHPLQVDIQRFAQNLGADYLQLFYSVAVHSRQELSLAPDEYAGFLMGCLRMLALMPASPVPTAPTPPTTPTTAGPDSDSNAQGADAPTSQVVATSITTGARLNHFAAPEPGLESEVATVHRPTDPTTTAPKVVPSVLSESSGSGEAGDATGLEQPGALAPQHKGPSSLSAMPPEIQSGGRAVQATNQNNTVAPIDLPPWEDAAFAQSVSEPETASDLDTAPYASDLSPSSAAALGGSPDSSVTQADPYAEPAYLAELSPEAEFEPAHLSDEEAFAAHEIPDEEGMSTDDGAMNGQFNDAQLNQVLAQVTADAPTTTPKRVALKRVTTENWPTIAATLPLSGWAGELARQSEWLGLSNGTQVQLRAYIHAADESLAKSRLATVLSEYFAQVVTVSIEFGDTGDATAHAVEQSARADRQAQAEQAAQSDPFINQLIEQFDATLVPGSVRAQHPTHSAPRV